jgi:hypothetical protein
MKLMEESETQLPRKQWKGILKEIEKVNAAFFEHIQVKINIRK